MYRYDVNITLSPHDIRGSFHAHRRAWLDILDAKTLRRIHVDIVRECLPRSTESGNRQPEKTVYRIQTSYSTAAQAAASRCSDHSRFAPAQVESAVPLAEARLRACIRPAHSDPPRRPKNARRLCPRQSRSDRQGPRRGRQTQRTRRLLS